MKTLDSGKDKIQKICDKLRIETLEPAKQEAGQIIEEAKARAEHILSEARKEADQLFAETRKQMQQERNVFDSALVQAGKQSIEAIRQSIEKDLFNDQLVTVLEKKTSESEYIAKVLDALVEAIEREGVSADFSAVLPKTVSPEDLAHKMANGIYEKLKKHPFTISDFHGGVQVKLLDRKMTIDITDETLKDLIANYIRKDFHDLLFKG